MGMSTEGNGVDLVEWVVDHEMIWFVNEMMNLL